MITQFNDYNTTQGYSAPVTLPRGGYVCKIVGAHIDTLDNGVQIVRVLFDVCEGEWSGYYQRKFDANPNENKRWPGLFNLNVPTDDGSERDGWTKRKFKTFTNALEESNPGYHFDWDESKFKGKRVGIIVNWREYEFNGNTGMTPNPCGSTSVEKIHNGDYKIPADRMRPKTEQPDSGAIGEFVRVPESADEDLPF